VRALEHDRLIRPVLDLDRDFRHVRRAAALRGFERARADQREARLARPADVEDDGILKRGPLADECGVLQLEIGEVPVQARVEARRKGRGDVGGEDRGAEQHGVETLGLDELRENVHPRLRQGRFERGVVGDEDSRRAVGADLLGKAFDSRAAENRGHVVSELGGLRDDAERPLDRLALVILDVDEGGHQTSFLSLRYWRIASAASPLSSIRRLSPRAGGSPTA
jgi:hypothetical protein